MTDDDLQRRLAELEHENAYLLRSNVALARLLAEAHQQLADAATPPPPTRLRVVKYTMEAVTGAVVAGAIGLHQTARAHPRLVGAVSGLSLTVAALIIAALVFPTRPRVPHISLPTPSHSRSHTLRPTPTLTHPTPSPTPSGTRHATVHPTPRPSGSGDVPVGVTRPAPTRARHRPPPRATHQHPSPSLPTHTHPTHTSAPPASSAPPHRSSRCTLEVRVGRLVRVCVNA